MLNLDFGMGGVFFSTCLALKVCNLEKGTGYGVIFWVIDIHLESIYQYHQGNY
jgi:hypothetical protein